MKLTLLILTLLTFVGCSNKAVYDGIQTGNRVECSQLPPSQYEDCMNKVNKTYDEYKRDRKELID